MIKFYKIFILITFLFLASCSSQNEKISIIKEDDLELQMIDAYNEGYEELKKGDHEACVVGLFADPERLSDIRRNRVALMEEGRSSNYTDIAEIKKEVEDSKKLFKKYNWPTIDVTRKSVEETAASIIKIIEISKNK